MNVTLKMKDRNVKYPVWGWVLVRKGRMNGEGEGR
jgi:hypothetical protein